MTDRIAAIEIPKDEIADFCRRWQIVELALFGSVLRDDFGPESDMDVLVTFAPEARWSLFDRVAMQDELKAILGREVDLVSRRGVERSRNYIRRKAILDSAEVFYVA
jgi:predicted nucleotidyltransferase